MNGAFANGLLDDWDVWLFYATLAIRTMQTDLVANVEPLRLKEYYAREDRRSSLRPVVTDPGQVAEHEAEYLLNYKTVPFRTHSLHDAVTVEGPARARTRPTSGGNMWIT